MPPSVTDTSIGNESSELTKSLIENKALKKGENGRRVKQLQQRLEAEEPELVAKLKKENLILDILVNILASPCAVFYFWSQVWDLSPWGIFSCVMCGIMWANGNGCYHDLTHRMPFGPFWTRVLAKAGSITNMGTGEEFYKRHRHHHALTGELGDPKMSRFHRYDGERIQTHKWERLKSLLIPAYQFYLHKVALGNALKKFSGKITINKTFARCEKLATAICYIYLGSLVNYSGYAIVKRIVLVFAVTCAWDANRMLLEHAAQDWADEWSQSTFLITGPVLKFLYFGVPTGDLHFHHHTWTKIPNYNLLMFGQQLNPAIINTGITVYHSYWDLFYKYFILNRPYGEDWSAKTNKKRA